MRIVSPIALTLLAWLTVSVAWAQPIVSAPHLTVQLVVPPAAMYPAENFTSGLYFRLEPGWHVYWINAGDSGKPPRVNWALPAGVTAEPMQFPVPSRLPLGPLMDFGYEREILFSVPMHVAQNYRPAGETAMIAARVEWLVCREVCIPGKAQLRVERTALSAAPATPPQIIADQQLIGQFAGTLPKPLPAADQARFTQTTKGFVLTVDTGTPERGAEFFPFSPMVIANAAPQAAKPLTSGIAVSLIKDGSLQKPPVELHGLLKLSDGTTYEIRAMPGTLAAAGSTEAGLGTVLRVISLAFLGGIILNLMPCVFPVLFIKGLALVQSSLHERRRMRAHGWVYALGILCSFWGVVALLLGLRAAGRQLGWGFQFQSPTFIVLLTLLLFFLGLSLAGQFEIGLTLTSAGGDLAKKQGYAGSFFTGVLAMVAATPCTAPFMGAAIGYALAHSAMVSFAVFTSLALGLAAPYLLLAYNPAWTGLLPRPGRWMEILKQAISIPIFGTVIWLIWVFTRLAGVDALVGLLASFLLLAIAGWVLGRWPGRSRAAMVAAIILLAGITLPVYAVRHLSRPVKTSTARDANTNWQPFTPEALAAYRSGGRPVFVDFTASWCLSCQVNERLVLDRSDVRWQLQDSGVALLRADWTDAEPTITQALSRLGRSGVPTYAIYPGNPSAPPQVLPEVLTPGTVIDALKSLPKGQQQSAQSIRPTSTARRSSDSLP